jgi:DMSO/TMAO reductase YedYZ molybdopterin-dependent catalytic subunit
VRAPARGGGRPLTPRGTDWSLAALVAALAASGGLVLWAGSPGRSWVYASHALAGFALAFVLVHKLRRVARRIGTRRAGTLALAVVALTLVSGLAWSTAGPISLAGFTLLAWHDALGAALAAAVLVHALARHPHGPRVRDFAGRRELLRMGAVGLVAVAAWRLQALIAPARRFTGSYAAASFSANDFPTTSWVADRPRPLGPSRAVRVTGNVAAPLALAPTELRGDALEATLDCTGGFYSRQRWRGMRLDRVLARAGPLGDHVRVVSHTGYRWSFHRQDWRRLLLATHVGDEPLSHGHGAPVRLVVPGRRGFQWVKWVVELEVGDAPDLGAPASTVWSSFTREGRGAA